MTSNNVFERTALRGSAFGLAPRAVQFSRSIAIEGHQRPTETWR